jgi:hypothetical protein
VCVLIYDLIYLCADLIYDLSVITLHADAADAASSQVDPNKAAECILGCLLWCSPPTPPADMTSLAPPPTPQGGVGGGAAAPVIQHLLIEALPQAAIGLSDNRQLATKLMLLYCSNGGSKLASKVSDTAWVRSRQVQSCRHLHYSVPHTPGNYHQQASRSSPSLC